jgi:hypothetical protein
MRVGVALLAIVGVVLHGRDDVGLGGAVAGEALLGGDLGADDGFGATGAATWSGAC